jgi:hypothetical protein
MADKLVSVFIPAASVSPKQMENNGWKCWAKYVTRFDYSINGPFAYQGPNLPVGRKVNLPVHAVVLHVDQSSNIGIGLVDETGEIEWEAVSDRFDTSLRDAAFRLFQFVEERSNGL